MSWSRAAAVGEHTCVAGAGLVVLDSGSSGSDGVVILTASVVGDGVHCGAVTLQFAQTSSNSINTTIGSGSAVLGVRT